MAKRVMLRRVLCEGSIERGVGRRDCGGNQRDVGPERFGDHVEMAVEVLSRSTEARDRGRKMQTFARFGVPEYWIVDPVANTLEVHRLDQGRYTCLAACGEQAEVPSAMLPGLTVATARLFEP